MADRAFAESRRNSVGGGDGRGGGWRCNSVSRWLLLNYKLTHVNQNPSQS